MQLHNRIIFYLFLVLGCITQSLEAQKTITEKIANNVRKASATRDKAQKEKYTKKVTKYQTQQTIEAAKILQARFRLKHHQASLRGQKSSRRGTQPSKIQDQDTEEDVILASKDFFPTSLSTRISEKPSQRMTEDASPDDEPQSEAPAKKRSLKKKVLYTTAGVGAAAGLAGLGFMMNQQLNPNATTASQDANTQAIQDALALKASEADMQTNVTNLQSNINKSTNDANAALALKANTTAVQEALLLKADQAAVTTALALKANQTALVTTNTNVSTALANAATADSKAVAAQSTANTALTNAATADSKAVNAQNALVTTNTNVSTALTNASNAQTTANTALTNAATADSLAKAAQRTADATNTVVGSGTTGLVGDVSSLKTSMGTGATSLGTRLGTAETAISGIGSYDAATGQGTGRFATVATGLTSKANTADVYAKTAADSQFAKALDVSNLSNTVNAAGTGLAAQVSTLRTTVGSGTTGLVGDVSSLKNSMGTGATSLGARLATAETAITEIGTYDAATRQGTGRFATVATGLQTAQTRADAAYANADSRATKAFVGQDLAADDAAYITSLAGRVNTNATQLSTIGTYDNQDSTKSTGYLAQMQARTKEAYQRSDDAYGVSSAASSSATTAQNRANEAYTFAGNAQDAATAANNAARGLQQKIDDESSGLAATYTKAQGAQTRADDAYANAETRATKAFVGQDLAADDAAYITSLAGRVNRNATQLSTIGTYDDNDSTKSTGYLRQMQARTTYAQGQADRITGIAQDASAQAGKALLRAQEAAQNAIIAGDYAQSAFVNAQTTEDGLQSVAQQTNSTLPAGRAFRTAPRP